MSQDSNHLNQKHVPDIDIDVGDRTDILKVVDHIAASKVDKNISQHNVGVYFQNIPKDPVSNLASIDYKKAEDYGYIKIDFLNLEIYKKINDNNEIDRLMNKEPSWELLKYEEIVKMLFHLADHYDIVKRIQPKSIEDLAICVALKMPGKRYLLDNQYNMDYIKENIWTKIDGIYFKKSHSIAYATVIAIQLNWIQENPPS